MSVSVPRRNLFFFTIKADWGILYKVVSSHRRWLMPGRVLSSVPSPIRCPLAWLGAGVAACLVPGRDLGRARLSRRGLCLPTPKLCPSTGQGPRDTLHLLPQQMGRRGPECPLSLSLSGGWVESTCPERAAGSTWGCPEFQASRSWGVCALRPPGAVHRPSGAGFGVTGKDLGWVCGTQWPGTYGRG